MSNESTARPTLRLWLVRHGETVFNREDLTQGWCNSPLTDEGRANVATLASELRGVAWSGVVSSPSERAMETAKMIVGRGTPIVQDHRWREYNFGVWEGRPNAESFAAFQAMRPHAHNPYAAIRSLFLGDYPALEGGESGSQFRSRVADAIADLRAKHDGDILVATHGMTIGVATVIADPTYVLDRSIGYATLSLLEIASDGVGTVHAYGVTSTGSLPAGQ